MTTGAPGRAGTRMAESGARRAGADLQAVVDELADELGRSVVVNDPVVRMLVTSRHFGDEDEVRVRAVLQRDAGAEVARHVLDQGVAGWSRAGVVPERPDLGLRPRLCVPVRHGGELLGLLMVIDADRSLTGSQVRRTEEVAAVAAALLARDEQPEEDRAARDRLVAGLLGDDVPDRGEAVSAAAAAGLPADAAQAVVTVLLAPGSARPEVATALRVVLDSAAHRHPHRSLAALAPGGGTLVQVGAHLDPAEVVGTAERMVAAAGRLLGGPAGPDGRGGPDRTSGVVAGVGGVVAGLRAASRSGRQARAAARGARAVPGLGPVACWEALGPYGFLLQLPDEVLGPDLVPEPVVRLLRHRSAPRLVETLRAFLDHGGSMPRTAEALHLHRTSLYYRLERIAEITGLDLQDGGNRLLLHTGLLVAELTGPDR
ncbi:helix-turn-helix domain-containing protein [Pseudonocardia kujensis]|uniref:helix-turn-helix domain-containing protein n=1 Tax=Pseudonocardia kujensis TaxID=1128675 RepID=UPI001E457E04|nr:helix-turn-helix domain-containing protein [Pseudonocardia kujensis]MCE0768060.1 helix-turn-helix domain-containing protein [Pseudonocardia kujensis]